MKHFFYLYILFALFFIFNINVKAENVACSYVMEKGSCDEHHEKNGYADGSKFIATINLDGEEKNNIVSIKNNKVDIVNNTKASKGIFYLKPGGSYISAVEYYKTYGSCPKYFAISEAGVTGEFDGYFIDVETEVNKSYALCIYPIEEFQYDKDFERKDEIYSCNLYSSNVLYEGYEINVQINYTKKTVSINSEDSDEKVQKAFEEYEKNFNFEQKNKCPINELKICVLGSISWVYPKDYDDTNSGACSTLDRSEKLDIGESYCGPFVKFSKELMENNYLENKIKLKDFCNSIFYHENYSDYKYSCINMCLNINDYIISEDLNSDSICGFSEKLILYIANIIKWVKYIIPVIVIVLGILDFIKAIASEKDDEMKKAQGSFIKRLIAAALIFIVPFIIEFILDKMGFDANGCGIIDL